jgi:type IV secretion system protein VirB10
MFTTGAEQSAPEANDEGFLASRLQPPRSRYSLQAGQVIPAALVTGLNSDLPGQVIAQVTAPVYDSVTGQHLLIPQGARLIGTYDNAVRYGDRRILLSWTRLILPNGWSLNLQEMRASDPTGAAGLTDRANNHLGRVGIAIGLSALISVVANESEDDGEESKSLSQSVGDAAAQQAAQTGSRIVDRELTVRPSLSVRPGAPVRVIVERDIQLRSYRP